MAKICEFCGRGPQAGASRSHSKIKTKRRVFVNLQQKLVDGVRARCCARCIKTMVKNKTA